MQEAIAARLKGYPQRAQRQMHRARVLIPAEAAAVLREDAQLAGPAVEAFYNRDADDMRAAARMTHFPAQVTSCMAQQSTLPSPNLTCADSSCRTLVHASVWRRHVLGTEFSVALTLVGLLQDMVSVVVTLNRCMYAQLEQQEFQAPPGFSIPPAKSPQHSAAQRGMKLTVGLEMLFARSEASRVCREYLPG